MERATPWEESTGMGQRPSAWLTALVEDVAGCMEAHSPMGALGWRSHAEEELVELVVYPTPSSSSAENMMGPSCYQDSPWMCRHSRPFSSA